MPLWNKNSVKKKTSVLFFKKIVSARQCRDFPKSAENLNSTAVWAGFAKSVLFFQMRENRVKHPLIPMTRCATECPARHTEKRLFQ